MLTVLADVDWCDLPMYRLLLCCRSTVRCFLKRTPGFYHRCAIVQWCSCVGSMSSPFLPCSFCLRWGGLDWLQMLLHTAIITRYGTIHISMTWIILLHLLRLMFSLYEFISKMRWNVPRGYNNVLISPLLDSTVRFYIYYPAGLFTGCARVHMAEWSL